MGYLRFLLALTVIFCHSSLFFGLKFVSGNIAVEAFFIISGFYMAFVLNEKYFALTGYYKLFITNRLLRLYPAYWVVLLLTVLAGILHGYINGQYGNLQVYIDNWHSLKPLTLFFLITSNIFVAGQDLFFFLTTNSSGGLTFTSSVFSGSFATYRFLLDVPLWTVSLELMFYLTSPFWVKLKTKYLIAICTVLLLVRSILKIKGVSYDPDIYRVFPLQLAFFLMGIICYHVYKRIKQIDISQNVAYLIIILITLFTFSYGGFADSELKDFLYLFSIFCSIPVLFKLTKSSKVDRWFGELSYPMYISHTLIIASARVFLQRFHVAGKYEGLICALLTVAFSTLLVWLVCNRVESFRAKRVKKKQRVENIETIPVIN
jgi:peptidoglycan/LPS O-acetylase OafA/YrhL